MALVIAAEDPDADAAIRGLIASHLEFARAVTPPGHVHALPLAELRLPSVTFFTGRREGLLVGIGALKELDATHAEIKSMHTLAEARGKGVGRAILMHLVSTARDRGFNRISLETGTMDAFAAARCLYASAGFEPCPPFGGYTVNPHSVRMTMSLHRNG